MTTPRLLLIGPLPRFGSPVGGTQVSFAELVASFRASGTFEVELVDTTRAHGYAKSWTLHAVNSLALARVVATVLRRGRSADVVFANMSAHGTILGGPSIAAACNAVGRPLAVRVFGGGLDQTLERTPAPWRSLFERTVLRSGAVLLQTEELCRRFAGSNCVRQLPTTRHSRAVAARTNASCRRFLFLSQLRPEKGVAEAMRAIELLPEGCTLSVCGPMMPHARLAAFEGGSRSRYVGEIESERVPQVLAEHDALVFPSYWPGEGLPGVVIEAMQSGLPVIAARWRSLPELVQHGANGLLVEPRSIESLASAMRRLAGDDELFARLRAGALERARDYTPEVWHPRLERWLLELCGRAVPDLEEVPAPLPRTEREVAR